MINIDWNMPFAEQLDYFGSKGIELSPDSWRDVWRDANSRAFTVARMTEIDVVKDIKSSIQDAINKGTTLKEFKEGLTDNLARKGWLTPEGEKATVMMPDGSVRKRLTGWRLDTIYKTNCQESYSVGRYKQLQDVKNSRPYWMYVAVMDAATRPSHAAMNGKIWHADHPIWDKWYPPAGFNCRCYVRSLSARQMKKLGLKEETGGTSFKPDEGFDYNPGAAGLASWTPDLEKYTDEVRTLAEASVKAKVFHNVVQDQDLGSFVAARNSLPEWQRAFVTQYDSDDYKRMKTHMLADGSAGYAVNDGELVSVFSKPGAHRGADVLESAIKEGADHLDCFDGFLPQYYKRYEFKEYKRIPWDDNYAPEGWDFERFGKPDIVFMKRQTKGK